jgi:hypothetical protein
VSAHGKSATVPYFFFVFAALCIAIGFLLAAIDRRPVSTQIGELMVFFGPGLVLLALGILLKRSGGAAIAIVGDEGMRVPVEEGTVDVRYEQIEETCQMFKSGVSVGLAFRERGQARWRCVRDRFARPEVFTAGVVDGYLRARVPAIMSRLQDGLDVSFKQVGLDSAVERAFVLGIAGYTKVATHPVRLSASRLELGGDSVALDSIVDVSFNFWTNRIRLKQRRGDVTALRFDSLFEPQLFIEVVQQLVSARAQAQA